MGGEPMAHHRWVFDSFAGAKSARYVYLHLTNITTMTAIGLKTQSWRDPGTILV